MYKDQFINGSAIQTSFAALRQQKGRYLTSSFVHQLQDTSYRFAITINQAANSQIRIILPKPEKIADKFVDLTFECMEHYWRKTIMRKQISEAQVLKVLKDITEDLYCLATYIIFSLNSK